MTENTPLRTRIHAPSMTAGEAEALLLALEGSRARLPWSRGGLDPAGLGRPHPPPALTLGGLPSTWPWSTTGRRCG